MAKNQRVTKNHTIYLSFINLFLIIGSVLKHCVGKPSQPLWLTRFSYFSAQLLFRTFQRFQNSPPMQKRRTSCSSTSLEATRSGCVPWSSWTRPSASSSDWPSPSLLMWWERVAWGWGFTRIGSRESKFSPWHLTLGWEESANDNQRVDEAGKWSFSELRRLWKYLIISTSALAVSFF